MDDANENIIDESGKEKSGSGKSTGKAGGGGGIRLPPNKLKEVMNNWQFLDANKVAARVAEFFTELPAKASANVQVKWDNLKDEGFAIVSQFLKWGQDKGREIAYLMKNLSRENAEILRMRYGLNVTGLG